MSLQRVYTLGFKVTPSVHVTDNGLTYLLKQELFIFRELKNTSITLKIVNGSLSTGKYVTGGKQGYHCILL